VHFIELIDRLNESRSVGGCSDYHKEDVIVESFIAVLGMAVLSTSPAFVNRNFRCSALTLLLSVGIVANINFRYQLDNNTFQLAAGCILAFTATLVALPVQPISSPARYLTIFSSNPAGTHRVDWLQSER
jgi:hypothetical protein